MAYVVTENNHAVSFCTVPYRNLTTILRGSERAGKISNSAEIKMEAYEIKYVNKLNVATIQHISKHKLKML
jgi:hypothetical protein